MGAPSLYQLDDVEAKIVAAVAAAVPAGTNVQSLSEQDFDADGNLVLQMPAVRVRFNAAPFDVKDTYRTVYKVTPQYDILCANKNLTSKAAQAQASLTLAVQTLPPLVGVSLTLTDGTKTEPLNLLGVSRFLDDLAGTVYVVSIAAPGFATFPGGN